MTSQDEEITRQLERLACLVTVKTGQPGVLIFTLGTDGMRRSAMFGANPVTRKTMLCLHDQIVDSVESGSFQPPAEYFADKQLQTTGKNLT